MCHQSENVGLPHIGQPQMTSVRHVKVVMHSKDSVLLIVEDGDNYIYIYTYVRFNGHFFYYVPGED